jgi:hypothetical protein
VIRIGEADDFLEGEFDDANAAFFWRGCSESVRES